VHVNIPHPRGTTINPSLIFCEQIHNQFFKKKSTNPYSMHTFPAWHSTQPHTLLPLYLRDNVSFYLTKTDNVKSLIIGLHLHSSKHFN
jgi:hypothetical protein